MEYELQQKNDTKFLIIVMFKFMMLPEIRDYYTSGFMILT